MVNNKKILFLTLKIFSATGGIEKVNRVAGKVLYDMVNEGSDELKIYSIYDKHEDFSEKYFPYKIFKSFNSRKFLFVIQSVAQGIKSEVVVLSHFNLLWVGLFIKFFAPKTKLILFAHGIEVWNLQSLWKKYLVHKCDLILPVSNYTGEVMQNKYNLDKEKISVINNCLDPFIQPLKNNIKNELLLKRYGLNSDNFILLTLSRLSSREKYKGCDKVILCISKLIKKYPFLRYLIVGKYDKEEKFALDKLIASLGLQNVVKFAGFVKDEELADHINLADLYIMPSEGEGFGIVFIEAMFYNKPVIAGNKDGSVDALCNGELGILVNPDSNNEISSAIEKVINQKNNFIPDNKILMQHFSYDVYNQKLKSILEGLYKYYNIYKDVKHRQNFSIRASARKIALDGLGFFEQFKSDVAFKKNRIQFIYVHHIFKDEEGKLRELIRVLSKYHSFISYSEAMNKILRNEIDKPYICFSSDDGFSNNLTGAKILQEFGIKACFFICPGIIEEKKYDKIKIFCETQLELPPVKFLNWKDVDMLLSHGHEIGSHTMFHKDLTKTPYDEMYEEIHTSYEIIKKRCGEIQHFAYPYGRFFHINEIVKKMIFETGYQSCTSAERGCHVQQLIPPVKEDLLIRRDHISLYWNLNHIRYFLRRNALKVSLQKNEFLFTNR